MSKPLPPSPRWEHLKKQAKRLLKDVRGGDPGALERFQAYHPKLKSDASASTAEWKLSDAQLVLAREHRFSSWSRLKRHVEFQSNAPAAPPQSEALADLFRAIEGGVRERIEALLNANPELINTHEPRFGLQPLHQASRYGRVEIARWLIEHGAELEGRDRAGNTPLHTAAAWNRLELTTFLVDRGANVRAHDERGREAIEKPLYYQDCRAVIEFLLSRGGEATWWTDLALEREPAIRMRVAADPKIIRSTYRVGEYVSIGTLHFAALRDSAKLVDLLLELGADWLERDEKKRTPADLALNMGHAKAFERLIAHGAHADAKLLERVGDIERVQQMRRLHDALVGGDLPRVCEVLDAQPDLINRRMPDLWGTGGTSGAAPLHWAAMFNHVAIIEELISRGADPTLRDETYDSAPLGWAREYERAEAAAVLEKHGALR